MNRRLSIALATVAATALVGIAPVSAEEAAQGNQDGTQVSADGSDAGSADGSSDGSSLSSKPAPGTDGTDDPTVGTGEIDIYDENGERIKFPASSEDPNLTSSENLSSTLLAWNYLSPEAENTIEWITFAIGILAAITQALAVIAPFAKQFVKF